LKTLSPVPRTFVLATIAVPIVTTPLAKRLMVEPGASASSPQECL
jgi:hypothetical protein